MKPGNKIQQRVFESSRTLAPVSETRVKQACKNCFMHIAKRTKKGITRCLECGHSWKEGETARGHCICPRCHAKLHVDHTSRRVFHDHEYFCVLDVRGGFQVLRFFYLGFHAKAGTGARYFHSEVVQRWIAPGGKHTTLAKLRPTGYFVDTWDFGGNLEIRPEKPLYNIMPGFTCPRPRLIPELKRGGYKKPLDKVRPFDLFHALLTDSRVETLLKAGQVKLLQFFTGGNVHRLKDYWPSIKICIRNGFRVEDASLWCDYIDLLRFFGKDLHNARYACPDDLQAAHDKHVHKKREWQGRQCEEEAREKAREHEAIFREAKSRFFGIRFTDGLINIHVLESVEEIRREGDAMHHCLFTNNYHLKPDSLILSARVHGQRVETIEVSLSSLSVLQSRGACNQITGYHDRIINLVKKHIALIRERVVA